MKNPLSVINHFYLNYPHNFIQLIWHDNLCMAEHLQCKFDTFYKAYGSAAVMTMFVNSLDLNNKSLLFEFINAEITYF